MTAAATYVLSLMMSVVPPRDSSNARWAYLDARETKEAATARYEEIAEALAAVAFDEAEAPLFGGSHGRARTAALLVAVAAIESGFRLDVDKGIGPKARGSGIDSCLMQVRPLQHALTDEGWTWRELVTDRQKCFRAGLHVLRRSMSACKTSPVLDKLSAYCSGNCTRGIPGSKIRMGLAMRLYENHPTKIHDSEWLVAKAPEPQPEQLDASSTFVVGGRSEE